MIFSDLASPAEALDEVTSGCRGFAQAGNRRPLFGIMLCTDQLFVDACDYFRCGHFVTSSTTIPVDGRTNRTLSLPLT